MSECNHCWHFTGDCLTSDPPWYRHICCHCGEYRNERSVLPVADGEHGEFVNSLPLRLRPKNKKGEIGMSENAQSEITEQQVRQQLENIQKQRMIESAQKIRDLAEELGVEIVGIPRLVEVAPGVTGIVADWGVRLKP